MSATAVLLLVALDGVAHEHSVWDFIECYEDNPNIFWRSKRGHIELPYNNRSQKDRVVEEAVENFVVGVNLVYRASSGELCYHNTTTNEVKPFYDQVDAKQTLAALLEDEVLL